MVVETSVPDRCGSVVCRLANARNIGVPAEGAAARRICAPIARSLRRLPMHHWGREPVPGLVRRHVGHSPMYRSLLSTATDELTNPKPILVTTSLSRPPTRSPETIVEIAASPMGDASAAPGTADRLLRQISHTVEHPSRVRRSVASLATQMETTAPLGRGIRGASCRTWCVPGRVPGIFASPLLCRAWWPDRFPGAARSPRRPARACRRRRTSQLEVPLRPTARLRRRRAALW